MIPLGDNKRNKFMYEKEHHLLAPRAVFLKRFVFNFIIGIFIILCSLALGMSGYIYFEKMSLVDAYENAAMILSGMGPVDAVKTVGGKLFAGTYALFSGIIFLVVIAIIFAPIFHRFLHGFLIKEKM
jgi:hypothetical protein